jgi:hypothetical protein
MRREISRSKKYGTSFKKEFDQLFKKGRANGYNFVLHRDRKIITVSRNRRHITTFALDGWGLDDAKHWLKAVCEGQA